MATKQPLNYFPIPRERQRSPVWSALAGWALVAPFLTVPAFVVGTAILQDMLVDGTGGSWQRAALRMGIPTGLATAAALAGAIRELLGPTRCRGWAISAVAANALAGGIILWGIIYA